MFRLEPVSKNRGTRAICFEHRRMFRLLIYGHGHRIICLQNKVQLSRCELALSWWRSGSATALLGAHHCHFFRVISYVNRHDIPFPSAGSIILAIRCNCYFANKYSTAACYQQTPPLYDSWDQETLPPAISGPCAHPPSLGQRGVAVSVVRRLQTNLLVPKIAALPHQPPPTAPPLRLRPASSGTCTPHHLSRATSSCRLGK